jgi:uncharacterized protein YuzE
MKISYDESVDALYIQLLPGGGECRTLRLSDEVALDLGPEEQLVGIEVLDARRVLGASFDKVVELENLRVKS